MAILGLGIVAAVRTWRALHDQPADALAEARAATDAGDWPRALTAWHAWNETGAGTSATLLVEAQLASDQGQSRAAAALAARVAGVDPTATAAWTIQLNRLRVLDAPAEALDLGLAALDRLRTTDAQQQVLKATTLATLAEVPDTEARDQLDRWIAADPTDTDAQAARLRRIAANPHPGDPDRATRIAVLEQIVAAHPEAIAPRAALTVALADAGEVDRGRTILTTWPDSGRDSQYDRLQARWDLDYDHQPERAVAGFSRALAATPHDWKLHYGLARAWQTVHQTESARTAALAVTRLRERLDPTTLGPRLTANFARIETGSEAEAAAARADLATLCRSVGLTRLAAAWDRVARREVAASTEALALPAAGSVQAKMSRLTTPATSVRRKSRPA